MKMNNNCYHKSSSSSSCSWPVFFVLLVIKISFSYGIIPSSSASNSASSSYITPSFHPLPETTVGAHCRWEIKLNTVLNRIPSTITEIFCRNPNTTCGGNTNYQCRQIRAKMVVAYTDQSDTSRLTLIHKQNTTISIGCSCVLQRPSSLDFFRNPPMEKRSSRNRLL